MIAAMNIQYHIHTYCQSPHELNIQSCAGLDGKVWKITTS